MRKILVNAVLFFPIVIFGCFNGDFSRENEQIALIQDQENANLDPRTAGILNKYGSTINKYSERYGIDWRLVVAVMKQESQFNHLAESHKGAEGLMQIMPKTQTYLAKEIGVDESIFDSPQGNIRGGIYYLAKLYRLFGKQGLSDENRIKFTLAAYNAGYRRVLDAQKMAKYVNDDPNDWKSIKNSFSLLSKKYSSLHRFVWQENKPSTGYFRDWRQTTNYVESIMEYYSEYKTHFDLRS